MAGTRKRKQKPPKAPIVELIVRRGALRRFDHLKKATAELPVKISWDQRLEDRRTTAARGDTPDRRKTDRRNEPPYTWNAADFVVVERPAASPPRSKRAGSGRPSGLPRVKAR